MFYWTLNNLFSLVKTFFYKLKNPQKVLRILTTVVGVLFLALGLFIYQTDSVKRKIFLIGIGLFLQIPLILPFVKNKVHFQRKELQTNRKNYILGTVFLTILVGVLIPSTFIAASPQEYIDPNYFHNPVWYIVSATCLAAGTFIVWMGVFYWLADSRWKVFFEKMVWTLCGVMVVNYMFFGTNLGVISSTLQYENGLSFTWKAQLINLLIVCVVAVGMYFFISRWRQAVTMVLFTLIITLGGMSIRNVVTVNKSVKEISLQDTEEQGLPGFQLSKTGKNVVVLMLDRSMGGFVPYILNERPDLKEQFSGFTYYANTISFGAFTNFGTPGMLGGYEYTPVEMNKRSDESLVSKHNEALKVMPVTFVENDFKVTVCDPVYANYQWIPDLSVFDDYPEINTYITKGKFGDAEQKESVIMNNRRNFFCFSIMKSMPLCVQSVIYNNGEYNQATESKSQIKDGMSKAVGTNATFEEAYNVLKNLSDLTKVTEDRTNTFLLMTNDTTHEPTLLQEPDYVPAEEVDNTEYDATHMDRFTLAGKKLNVQDDWQMSHYHINMAALLRLGRWFDYLRENDVYDNTKIILVADHGEFLASIDELYLGEHGEFLKDVESYFPLLMVKDFDAKKFTTSYEFMTNADVPSLAMSGLIDNPKNPFTGKIINSEEKSAHDQFIIMSNDLDISVNNGNTFLPAGWISVKENIWDKDNWKFYDEKTVLKEHVMP